MKPTRRDLMAGAAVVPVAGLGSVPALADHADAELLALDAEVDRRRAVLLSVDIEEADDHTGPLLEIGNQILARRAQTFDGIRVKLGLREKMEANELFDDLILESLSADLSVSLPRWAREAVS